MRCVLPLMCVCMCVISASCKMEQAAKSTPESSSKAVGDSNPQQMELLDPSEVESIVVLSDKQTGSLNLAGGITWDSLFSVFKRTKGGTAKVIAKEKPSKVNAGNKNPKTHVHDDDASSSEEAPQSLYIEGQNIPVVVLKEKGEANLPIQVNKSILYNIPFGWNFEKTVRVRFVEGKDRRLITSGLPPGQARIVSRNEEYLVTQDRRNENIFIIKRVK